MTLEVENDMDTFTIAVSIIVWICVSFLVPAGWAVWCEFRKRNDESTYGPIDLTKNGKGNDYRFRGRL